MAEATFEIAQLAADTGGGDQTFTLTLGTPNAALFFATLATANNSVTAHAQMTVGYTDESTHHCSSVSDLDAVGTTDANRQNHTDELLSWFVTSGGSGLEGETNLDNAPPGFQTNKINIAWGNSISTAVLMHALGMVVTNAAVVEFTTPVDTTLDVACGFEPNVLIFVYDGGNSGAQAVDKMFSVGFAVNNSGVEQGCHVVTGDDGVGTSVAAGQIANNKCMINHSRNSTSNSSWDITAFNAGPTPAAGFTINGTTSQASHCRCLALDVGDSARTVVQIESPTASGNKSYSTTGVDPAFVMLLCSNHQSYNSSVLTGDAEGNTTGFITANEEFCVSNAAEDGQATTDTQSVTDNKAVNHYLHDGTSAAVGTGPSGSGSFDTGGFTINYTGTPDSTARKWLALAIGSATPAGTAVPSVGKQMGGTDPLHGLVR